jgi:thiamine kinase-like enzyme
MGDQCLEAPRPDAVLDGLNLLGSGFRLRTLVGGLTNRNYQVTTNAGKRYVARFSGADSALLAIDRDAEAYNSRVAAEVGVAPGVVAYCRSPHVLLIEWLDARTLSDADLDDSGTLVRIAGVCRRLHAGPRFLNDFDIFDVQRSYLEIVRDRGFRLPADYLDFAPTMGRIEDVLRASGSGTVACHNDLLAANILDDGSRIWFVDFEYAGNNDACFELGNIWSEAGLPDDRLEHLVSAYFGARSPARVARAHLFGTAAKYAWTLWASIQDGVSEVEFDFWQWGMEKYVRAVEELRDGSLPRWIDLAGDVTTDKGVKPWLTPPA